jgi:amino acid adenylation domain-containing protein
MWVVPEDELWLRCGYDSERYQPEAVRQMLNHFCNLLVGMTASEEQRVWDVRLLSPAEEQQMLRQGNGSAAEYDSEVSVTGLFERQVERTPEATALLWEGQRVSYAELNRRANQLGHYLRRHGVGPDSLVALVMERSVEMVVAVLGVLKAGGAYLPVDPSFPSERVRFMLEDAGAAVVLTSANAEYEIDSARVVRLAGVLQQSATESAANLETGTTAENLAYVIYTSGSTGRPKGVMVPHRSLTNFLLSIQQQFEFSRDDVLVAVTTLSFDIAGLELFVPLISGAQVAIASRAETVDAHLLAALMEGSGVTVMQATPATWRMLLDAGWRARPDLRLLCGGEALNRELADRLVDCGETWNMYGPTETTIWSSTHRVDAAEEAAIVSLGRPIANTGFYVVDERMHLVPTGVPGELLIGGDGVTRGYLNRPELTAERFICDPFSTTGGARLYRTGDRVRWDADGRLEYLGRLDHQVKIRGFRIETGEIEAVLAEHEQILQAVVTAHEDFAGNDQLVAYVVTEAGAEVSTSELRRHLSAHLPEYMIPAVFVPLAELPLTANGKLDRKALPAPDGSRPVLEREFVAPRSETEKLLAEIWSEVLGVSQVGIHDNFFELGGHSLLATTVISRIRASFSVELPLRYLFEARTIARLALAIAQGQAADVPAIERIEEQDDLELMAQLDDFSDDQIDAMLHELITAD